jgi:ligand-binding sensor domain-containing protein
VNALLPAGGVLYVASLRGAARFDGQRLTPIEGPGAAFSLAATRDGVAIGYGQGVLLPGSTLLSAFHGLPGNQAVALAAGESLFVGTPSGLGAMDGRRVRWRVTSADGRLPHPWVTALAVAADGLYVGTYGGGLTRRAKANGITRPFADPAHYQPFEETADLKVNPGCLVEAGGRIYAGTDGRGLWELSADRTRFEPMRLPLPSPRVTALVADDHALWIGTDEGIARLPLHEGNP